MIDDYFLYFVGAIVFLALACYVYAFGKECRRFQKEHPEVIERLQHELLGEEQAEILERQRHEREQRKNLREAYRKIRSEAFSEIPRNRRELSEKARLHKKKVAESVELICHFPCEQFAVS